MTVAGLTASIEARGVSTQSYFTPGRSGRRLTEKLNENECLIARGLDSDEKLDMYTYALARAEQQCRLTTASFFKGEDINSQEWLKKIGFDKDAFYEKTRDIQRGIQLTEAQY